VNRAFGVAGAAVMSNKVDDKGLAMTGYILLADGMRLDGRLVGPAKTVVGWVAANTAVVGFQEMVTDPAYKGRILAFTYPEIGNVGVTEAFSESPHVQVAALVVRELNQFGSHYLSEGSFESMLGREGAPCLCGIDTRGLAVHLRQKGEMAAAIAPDSADEGELAKVLRAKERPEFEPSNGAAVPSGRGRKKVAVINLGVRKSHLGQLATCCTPVLFGYDASPDAILACKPVGIFVSDGSGAVLPPSETVKTVKSLLGRVPLFGCGLGQVALGMALGCKAAFLKRGHHGVNYPVRNTIDGAVEVTAQRHTVMLDRDSVSKNRRVQILWENMNDGTVEGIQSTDGTAVGMQAILAAPKPGGLNAHIAGFVQALGGD